jgi:DNA-binding transcriptional MerR regulator
MITMVKPSVENQQRYSVGQTAALLGIHRNTLKTYTDSNLIKARYHVGTMRKFYYGYDILRFWRMFV